MNLFTAKLYLKKKKTLVILKQNQINKFKKKGTKLFSESIAVADYFPLRVECLEHEIFIEQFDLVALESDRSRNANQNHVVSRVVEFV